MVEYDPGEVKKKLQTAFEILPISIVIVGWDVPQHLIEVCSHQAKQSGAKLYRWQPLLTGDGALPIKDKFRVIGFSGNPVKGHLDLPEFTFMCPNNPAFTTALFTHLEKVFQSGKYDGVFLDRMRFPSLASDPGNFPACFCPFCREKASLVGLDLSEVEICTKEMLGSEMGVRNFVRLVLDKKHDLSSNHAHKVVHNFMKFHAESITHVVRQAAKLAHSYGLSVGLDCFSPSLSYSVGQDLAELNTIGDWIKPMTYLHTFAPAGMPYELNGLLQLISRFEPGNAHESLRWLAETTQIPVPDNSEALLTEGLPAQVIKTEVSQARKSVSIPLLAGIELVEVEKIISINMPQLTRDLHQLKESSADGVVISWDLWHIREEYLHALADALYLT